MTSAAPRRRIVREPDGRIAVRLLPRERRVLGALVSELAAQTALEAQDEVDLNDDGLARLWPDALDGDLAGSAAFRDMVASDLDALRAHRFAVVAETLDSDHLDGPQASAWLGAVNDLRLVHGTRLGVSEETGSAPLDEADPEAGRTLVFLWLGWVEEQLVDALAAGLPEVTDEG